MYFFLPLAVASYFSKQSKERSVFEGNGKFAENPHLWDDRKNMHEKQSFVKLWGGAHTKSATSLRTLFDASEQKIGNYLHEASRNKFIANGCEARGVTSADFCSESLYKIRLRDVNLPRTPPDHSPSFFSNYFYARCCELKLNVEKKRNWIHYLRFPQQLQKANFIQRLGLNRNKKCLHPSSAQNQQTYDRKSKFKVFQNCLVLDNAFF